MTGFGAAEGETPFGRTAIEIRSVNHRQLKTQFRLPDALSQVEPKLDRWLRASVQRGSVVIRIFVREPAAGGSPVIHEGALKAAVTAARAAAGKLGLKASDNLHDYLAFPGVLADPDREPSNTNDSDAADSALKQLFEQAVAKLIETRESEGKMLVADLAANAVVCREKQQEIAALADGVAADLLKRTRERLDRLLADRGSVIADSDLAREAALLADRADISEEIVRLGHHIETLETTLAGTGAVGISLEFLAQELLRETNTICAKAAKTGIVTAALALKTAIERIREQVQNLE
jgi:uncharacterized protein (TIGR00255 family)